MQIHVDADSLVYATGFALEEDTWENCRQAIDTQIERLVEVLGATSVTIYLSGNDNFRDKIATQLQYKGNRIGKPKPKWYHMIRSYLGRKYDAEIITGMEADDKVSIVLAKDRDSVRDDCGGHPDSPTFDDYHKEYSQVIICHIDKDINMCQGWHYSWIKGRLYYITEEQGRRNFYTQLLTGDKACDNIPGIDGIGPKKAAKILDGCHSEQEMWEAVLNAYKDICGKDYDYVYCQWDEGHKHYSDGTWLADYKSWWGQYFSTTLVDYITERARLLWMMEEGPNAHLTNLWTPPV